MRLRVVEPGDITRVRIAISYLKRARKLLKQVGAIKTLSRVRKALKSAEGAERHVLRCEVK